MPLPPGTSAFPPESPASLRRTFYVSNWNADGRTMTTLGPFAAIAVLTGGTVTVQRGGIPTEVDLRVKLPLSCGAAPKSIVRDRITGTAYEVLEARPWLDGVEIFAFRSSP